MSGGDGAALDHGRSLEKYIPAWGESGSSALERDALIMFSLYCISSNSTGTESKDLDLPSGTILGSAQWGPLI